MQKKPLAQPVLELLLWVVLPNGFVPLSGIGSGNYSYYVLEEAGNFEIGQGTYSSVGNTFSRDTILSTSNSDDSKIDLGRRGSYLLNVSIFIFKSAYFKLW